MKRLVLVLTAGLMLAGTADARRTSRWRRPARRVVVGRTARPATPVVEPVRNVILFVANGYGADDWRDARAAKPAGILALDRMPVTGVALLPEPLGRDTSAALARLLGEGEPSEGAELTAEPVMAYAKRAGKSVALVAAESVTDPLPGFLAVPSGDNSDAAVLRRLAAARVDVLFGRSAPIEAATLTTNGYQVLDHPETLLMAETTPIAATAPADAVPYDTLFFRALHLVAKNKRGFFIGAGADPRRVKPSELDAALAAAVQFARSDGHTLVLMVSRTEAAPATIFADGQSAAKFTGTLAASDIPKIAAGVMGLKDFRRDFSPFFAARSQPAPATRTALDTNRSGLSLPW